MTVHILRSALYWSWILLAAINGFFLYKLARPFLELKDGFRWRAALFTLLCGTGGMVIWVGDNNLLFTLPVFLLGFLAVTRGSRLGRLTLAVIFFCLIMSICALADTYLKISPSYDAATSLIRLVIFGLIFLALRGRLPKEPVKLSPRLWRLLCGLAAMPFCALVAVVLLTYRRYDSQEVEALAWNQGLVVLPFVLLTSIVLLLAVGTLADYVRLTHGERLAGLREVYYQGLQREQMQVRTLRHDMRNHLAVLQGLLEQNSPEKAETYLTELLGSPALGSGRRLCENETANVVLSAKWEELESRGLTADFEVSLPAALAIADTDLCALLGNALDNAMEAAAKAEDKRIVFRCRAEKGLFMLKVENTFAGEVQPELSTTKADKASHGLGLPGMREIAARYEGTLETRVTDGRFELMVCLPIGRE